MPGVELHLLRRRLKKLDHHFAHVPWTLSCPLISGRVLIEFLRQVAAWLGLEAGGPDGDAYAEMPTSPLRT